MKKKRRNILQKNMIDFSIIARAMKEKNKNRILKEKENQ